MADRHTKEFDAHLERMITGPKITMLAPESNVGKIHVHIDGDEQTLVPGQSAHTFGYGIVVVSERSGDACHVTIG